MRYLTIVLGSLLWFAAGSAVATTRTRPPVLSVSPTSLTFNAPLGGPNPLSQAVRITNTGSGRLNWTATDGERWLSETPSSGRLGPGQSEPMAVFVDVTSLAAGTYNGTITVTDPGVSGSPATVSVTLTVSASPVIGLSPTSLTFSAPFGGPNPSPQIVTVSNTGGGTLNWGASDTQTWLSETPALGSLSAGASEPMSVSVDVTGLAAGTYMNTIMVDATGASNTPQTVAVTLTVSATPTIGLSPTSLTFNAPVGGPNPSPQTVTVSNTGGGTLNWSAANIETWLSQTPASGSLSGGASEPMSVLVDVTGLAAGTYTDTISVDATGASNTPQTVSVTLNVSDLPAIGLSPTTLTFSAPLGGPNPSAQVVTVSNTGDGTLTWSASDGETWLSESPASGSLSAGASEPMSVSVDVTGLAAGTYTGVVTVSDVGASNSPQTVSVTLNVSSSPTIGLSPTSLTFDGPLGGPNPGPQTVTVSNTGGGTLNWSATDSETWLSVNPTSGGRSAGASEPMAVSANVTGLAIGTYTGTISVSDAGASNTPQTVSVTLNVSNLPIISLNPTSRSFNAPLNGVNPLAQPISITNSGLGTLNWSATDNAAWMSVNPSSGSLSPVQSEPVTVSISVSGLAAGTYTGTITVTDVGAANSPQIVFVTLTVPALVKPEEVKAGLFCGFIGLEVFAPLSLLWFWRRRSRRGGCA